mgnify:CR=1 FL=1
MRPYRLSGGYSSNRVPTRAELVISYAAYKGLKGKALNKAVNKEIAAQKKRNKR